MSDYEVHKAANEYVDRSFPKDAKALKPAGLMNDAFCAGVEWARAQWPITPRTAEEAKPEDFGQALGLMWADLGKKLEEVSIFCGALEGQANRIQRETAKAIGEEFGEVGNMLRDLGDQVRKSQAIGVDVGQKVEAVISLVDDLDELIRSEDDKPEAVEAYHGDEDEAFRPAVGMFGIGGDASVVTPLRAANRADDPERYITAKGDYELRKPVTPTLRNVLKAIEDVRALAVDAGIQFDFSVSTRS